SRSGEGEYFINRVPARLRDIADMLRGTGLGADTGVVIESKMIDALLSDRPDDRRELFEEAAGVGLYRDRRRTTERRLEETTVDLQRLDDLVNEVQSQVRSLSRQRKRAERYAELMARRFTVEIGLARREMKAWTEELRRLEERVTELRDSVPRLEEAVAAAEQARDPAHGNRAAADARRRELSRLVATRDELARHVATEDATRATVAEARASMESAQARMRALQERLNRAELDRERGHRERDELLQRIEQLEDERIALVDGVAAIGREQEEATVAVERARKDAERASRALDDARGADRRIREEESIARAELFRADEAHTSLTAKANALETLERERVGLAPAAARLLRDR